MDYMQAFARQQAEQAYGYFRPEFAQQLFIDGLSQAQELAFGLAACLFPSTDCTAGHYQTCFDFFSTYALTRLMGYDSGRAESTCKGKYSGLTPEQYQRAFALCAQHMRRSFPTLSEPAESGVQ